MGKSNEKSHCKTGKAEIYYLKSYADETRLLENMEEEMVQLSHRIE